MSFFAELKRRKILRVATLYVVVAWLLIQVAATIAPLMNLPEAAPRLVLFLLIILFPVALLLAWAYQITPDGIRLDTGPAAMGAAPPKGMSAAIVAFIGLVLAAGFGLYIYNRPLAPAPTETAATVSEDNERELPADKSIAVLPFTAFSSSEDDRFFADGLSDTLLNKLAQLSNVRVISRSASFQYRGDAVDVRRVGNELNVATVLEGSVQRSGDRLRIIAQLIDTASEDHIWSATFDRSGNDIFAIHDEIADAVVDNLAISLTPEEHERMQSTGTGSVEAYNLLTSIVERYRSELAFNLSTQEYKERSYREIDEIRDVLQLDPGYAAAYRAIAGIYSGLLFQAFSDEDHAYHLRKGYEALYQAMLLEPDDPVDFVTFAGLSRREDKYDQAETFARMAFAKLPNSLGATVELMLALVAQNKSPAEALALVELEESLDPTTLNQYRRKTFALTALGRSEEALEVARSALAANPEYQLASADVASILSRELGRYPEAFAALIDVRTRMEDEVGDVVLAEWRAASSALGLNEEVEKLGSRLPGEDSRVLTSSSILASDGRLPEAIDLVRSYIERSGTSAGPMHLALARLCFELRDFECAITQSLIAAPQLDARGGREPSVVIIEDFETAIPLVLSLRAAGDANAAVLLLQAVNRWYGSRAAEAADGYVRTENYFLPELYLLRGDEGAALGAIRERVMLGGQNFIPQCGGCTFDSPIYDSIRDNAEFRDLTAEYERRRQAAATEVRAMIDKAGF